MNRTPVLPLLFAVAFSAGLICGCHKHAESPTATVLPSIKVQTIVAENKKRVTTEEVVGTVRSKLHAVIEAKITGRVEKMLLTAGQSVKREELLAQLDAAEIQARLDQAVALREQLARDADRLGRLFTNNTVSASEFEAVQSRLHVANAAANEAETMLGYTKILAPFDGVVTRKLADVGDLATPGKPLVEMEDFKTLRLEADVPESLAGRVQFGAKMPVHVASVNGGLEGTISEIAPTADPSSRTFRVVFDLPTTAGLRAGQFGRVAIPVGENSALRVPASALVQRGQMEIVFVAADGRAQMRLVKSGQRLGDEVELLSGVSAGERVIVSDAATLIDGRPVEVQP